MFGWMILFGLMALPGMILMLAGHQAGSAIGVASAVFASLFALCLLTRAVRGRAG